MPFSPELGMRVYDPREGEEYGLRMGQIMAQAMQNAQRRQLSERELALAEKQAGLKARQILLRQDGLTQMTQEVAQRSQGLDPNDPQSSLKMRSIRMEALIKAAPKLFADDPDALVRVITAKEAAQPGLEAVRDPITGKPRTVIRHPDGSITAVPIDPSEVLTPEEKARRDYDKLMQDKKVFDSLAASNPDRSDIKRLQASANNQLEAWHIQHKSDKEFKPSITTVTSPTTGKPIDLIQTGPKSYRPVTEKEAKPTELEKADRSVLTARLKKLDAQEALDFAALMEDKADAKKRKQLSDTWTAIYDTRDALRRFDTAKGVQSSETQPPPTAQPSPETSEKVLVEKDGQQYRLPKSQLPEAEKQGYKLVNAP